MVVDFGETLVTSLIIVLQVMYNHACGLYFMGRLAEAKEELERAKAIAASTTESRHKIIVAALDNIRVSLSKCIA